MKKKIITFGLLMGCFSGQTQPLSVEKSFRGQQSCLDIERTAMMILPSFYQLRQFDSIALTLDFVGHSCVESNMLRMSRFLLDIHLNRLSDTTFDSHDVFVLARQARSLRQHGYDAAVSFEPLPIDKGMPLYGHQLIVTKRLTEQMSWMLRQWHNELLQREGLSNLEKSVLHHLRWEEGGVEVGNNLFAVSNGRAYRRSPLRKAYRRFHDQHVIDKAWYVGVGYGRWLQQGAGAPYYGNRSGMYLSGGKMISRYTRLGGHIMGRFGTAASPYSIVRPDTVFKANKVSVTALGLEVAHTVWRPNARWGLGILLGAGMEHRTFFNDLPQDDEVAGEPNDLLNDKLGQSYGNRPYGLVGAELACFLTPGLSLTLTPRYQFIGRFDSYIGTNHANGGVLMLQLGLAVYIAR